MRTRTLSNFFIFYKPYDFQHLSIDAAKIGSSLRIRSTNKRSITASALLSFAHFPSNFSICATNVVHPTNLSPVLPLRRFLLGLEIWSSAVIQHIHTGQRPSMFQVNQAGRTSIHECDLFALVETFELTGVHSQMRIPADGFEKIVW